MEQMLENLSPVFMDFVITVIGIVLAYVGNEAKKIYNKYIDNQQKQDVVEHTVAWAEQIYKDLDGPSKFQEVLKRAEAILKEQGISITRTELETLIESAVHGWKQGWDQPTIIEDKEVK